MVGGGDFLGGQTALTGRGMSGGESKVQPEGVEWSDQLRGEQLRPMVAAAASLFISMDGKETPTHEQYLPGGNGFLRVVNINKFGV